ncbi:hypothetical protein H4582DRAFT_2072636 [Lactarius indigo]|nr:hypothetical protein H4582DRAFT_2072636 [Lactarius indigo]
MTILATYVICFYDWIISLDQEVALIYPASWNVVKGAYIFCRYYPLAVAPFHLWGLVGNHEQRFCKPYYHALFACAVPTMLSAQFILMLRTYAFSGRKTRILVVLSITYLGLIGVIIWVISKHLSLFLGFVITKRSGCFAISDQLTFNAAQATSAAKGITSVPVPLAYHIGMISILTTVFDCLNMFIVVWHWIRHGSLGPLGQSFIKQGILVYVIMTALNALTIGTFFSPYMVHSAIGSNSSLAYILPSTLVIYFSPRKASPTETELRLEHSHMINEALEMIAVEWHPEEISENIVLSNSTDTEAQP